MILYTVTDVGYLNRLEYLCIYVPYFGIFIKKCIALFYRNLLYTYCSVMYLNANAVLNEESLEMFKLKGI